MSVPTIPVARDLPAGMLERNALTSRPQDTAKPAEQVDVFPSDSSSGRVMEKRRQ